MSITVSRIHTKILNQLRKVQKKPDFRKGIPYELVLIIAGCFIAGASGAQKAFTFLKRRGWLQERTAGTYSVTNTAPKWSVVGEKPVPLSTKELNRLVRNYKATHHGLPPPET